MGLVNRLLGNRPGAAVIELTVRGPSLRFSCDAHVAVVGAGGGAPELRVEGREVAADAVVPVRTGQQVEVSGVRGTLRAYLGVAGGFDTPVVMGSRSSDLLAGLGPGPLRPGDRLAIGQPGRPRGLLTPPLAPGPAGPATVRVLAGPHPFAPSEIESLVTRTWTVGENSNRVGLRLADGATALLGPGSVASVGMVAGAIQVPPDGRPIVLMPDHATVGGYPVLACVITADLPVLARLRPGDTVRFSTVDRTGAWRALDDAERMAAGRVSGWYPTAS